MLTFLLHIYYEYIVGYAYLCGGNTTIYYTTTESSSSYIDMYKTTKYNQAILDGIWCGWCGGLVGKFIWSVSMIAVNILMCCMVCTFNTCLQCCSNGRNENTFYSIYNA